MEFAGLWSGTRSTGGCDGACAHASLAGIMSDISDECRCSHPKFDFDAPDAYLMKL